MRCLSVLLLLLLPSFCWGQEYVIPEESSVGECVVVTLKTPAKFASLKVLGRQTFTPIQTYQLKDLGDGTKRWNWTGLADEYAVWITTFDPETGIQEFAGKTVIKQGDAPNPPDPPHPPDPKPGALYRIYPTLERSTTDNLPRGQQLIISSLTFRDKLAAKGHDFGEVVSKHLIDSPPQRLSKIAQAVREANLPLPVVVLEPLNSEGPLRVFALPSDGDALMELLK